PSFKSGPQLSAGRAAAQDRHSSAFGSTPSRPGQASSFKSVLQCLTREVEMTGGTRRLVTLLGVAAAVLSAAALALGDDGGGNGGGGGGGSSERSAPVRLAAAGDVACTPSEAVVPPNG